MEPIHYLNPIDNDDHTKYHYTSKSDVKRRVTPYLLFYQRNIHHLLDNNRQSNENVENYNQMKWGGLDRMLNPNAYGHEKKQIAPVDEDGFTMVVSKKKNPK